MSFELDRARSEIDKVNFSVQDAVQGLLAKGHVIHGYSSGSNERIIRITQSVWYSEGAPLLGYGADGTAERALGRALLTYGTREQRKIDVITIEQFPEAHQNAIVPDRNNSKFDHVVWSGDIFVFQDGDMVTAASSYGGKTGLSPLRVQAHTPLAAIALLADTYNYMGIRVAHLPTLSFE